MRLPIVVAFLTAVAVARFTEAGQEPTPCASGAAFARTRSLPPGPPWPRCRDVGAAQSAAPPSAYPPPGTVVGRRPVSRLEAARFLSPSFTPVGLAFDAVSQRFVIGDSRDLKLMVVTPGGSTPVDMVRAESAGFGAIAALELDAQRGELWVAGAAGAVHRLQLVSGRPLRTYRQGPALGDVRLVDLGLTPSGTLMGLDAEGERLLTLGRGTQEWRGALPLSLSRVTSLAVAEDGIAFVAHEGGVARADLRSREVTPLGAGPNLTLLGIERLRYRARTLIAVQRESARTRRVLMLRLDGRLRRVTQLNVFDDDAVPGEEPLPLHLAGRDLYDLVVDPKEPDAGRHRRYVVRKLTLP